MKLYRLRRTQFLPISLETAWPFFATPINLEQITPAFLRFEITSEVPAQIRTGLVITYRIAAIAGIPMTWVTEIKSVEPPYRFIDEQRIGPFKFWHHEHRFRAVDHGIEMEDLVNYAMPYGYLGQLVHKLVVGPRLERIFDFRQRYLADLFAMRNVVSMHRHPER